MKEWDRFKASRFYLCGGLRQILLWIGAVTLFGFGVANVVRYARETESIDYLSKKAFSEVRAYWRNPEGPDPQTRWWKVFWKLSGESDDPEARLRAANISLTMLANLGQWEAIQELVAELEPEDPILERSLAIIGRAHLETRGGSALVGFLSQTIRSHSNPRLRARAALALVRYFIDFGRYQAATAVLRDFDWPPHWDDEDIQGQWNAAHFELERLLPGMVSPPFELRDTDGRSIRPHDLLGTPFVLLFWSPDCGPSSLMLDTLFIEPVEGVQVIAVSESPGKFGENPPSKAGFCFALDRQLAKQWNVYATPTAMLFARDGRLEGKAHSSGDLARLVQSLRQKEDSK